MARECCLIKHGENKSLQVPACKGARSLFLLEANKTLAGVDLKVPNLPALVCFQPQHQIGDSPCVYQALRPRWQAGAVGPRSGDFVPPASPAGRGEGQSCVQAALRCPAQGAAGGEVGWLLCFSSVLRRHPGSLPASLLVAGREKSRVSFALSSASPGSGPCPQGRGSVCPPVSRRGRGSTGTSAPSV